MQNRFQQYRQNILEHDQVVASRTILYTMVSVSSNIPVKQVEQKRKIDHKIKAEAKLNAITVSLSE